ncbi:hypothetical protein [Serratia odorifera]|uniref:hypothetical protein n=1 Tax=Serratia odorifera TaxID=618 RepID=UPI0018E7F01A|nr:hypothetical protein [Serratia odorifera]MBJ2064573.1 hypothetical protein [Serratia odorifera]
MHDILQIHWCISGLIGDDRMFLRTDLRKKYKLKLRFNCYGGHKIAFYLKPTLKKTAKKALNCKKRGENVKRLWWGIWLGKTIWSALR